MGDRDFFEKNFPVRDEAPPPKKTGPKSRYKKKKSGSIVWKLPL